MITQRMTGIYHIIIHRRSGTEKIKQRSTGLTLPEPVPPGTNEPMAYAVLRNIHDGLEVPAVRNPEITCLDPDFSLSMAIFL